MLDVKPTTIRSWSMLGTRGTFGVALLELSHQYPEIIAMSADLRQTSGLDRFSAAYPERFFNAGIAEQNMVGVAAGFAASGFVPFATSFANFLSLRSCEQVRHYMGYMGENIKLVGLASGFAMGTFGATHHGIEDIASIRAIAGITILSPADCAETVKMTEAALHFDGPVYLRLTGGMRTPIVYKNDYELRIGQAITLRDGGDIAIVATGSMVHYALKAAEKLAERGIESTVINMHTIKPLDTTALDLQLDKKLIVTVEEHSIIGGLGGAVAEHLTSKDKKPQQVIVGIPQGYIDAGDYGYLLAQCGLTTDGIVDSVLRHYG
ncbi:transketolase C-terminal domain-containing protein [Pectobacterium brasiliense]|uniref:transketolase C-terminal domain-containing protein n=1 Tax=Pectobacterium brasiliense TaxID=180957 RepID=UPI0019691D28|nr:transketolase [Pectobacterium brasiliense]